MDKGMEESILRPTCDARDQSLALGEAGGVDQEGDPGEHLAKELYRRWSERAAFPLFDPLPWDQAGARTRDMWRWIGEDVLELTTPQAPT